MMPRGKRRARVSRQLGTTTVRLQIDHLIALDNAEVQAAICFETDDFHEHSLTWMASL